MLTDVQDDLEQLYRDALKGTQLCRDSFQGEMERRGLYYDRDQTGESGWRRAEVDRLPYDIVVVLYRRAKASRAAFEKRPLPSLSSHP